MKLLSSTLLCFSLWAAGAQAATIDLTRTSSLQSASATLYAEQTNVAPRDGAVTVDYLVGTNLNVGDDFSGIDKQNGGQSLGAGMYDSFLIHFNPNGEGSTAGSFTFAGDIVAIIVSNFGASTLLNDSDGIFGDLDTYTYDTHKGRRTENHDDLTLVDAKTLSFTLSTGASHIDNIRVITAVVPLPASFPLLLAGLGGFAALRRRQKS